MAHSDKISITISNVSKRFSRDRIAVDQVSLEALGGEIHAILGENGAGKTTLMKILAGIYRPDEGSIKISGEPFSFKKPMDAKKAGIGMVHQNFSLIPALSVADNLTLGEVNGSFFINPEGQRARLKQTAERLGFNIRLESFVRDLSMGEKQMVEIFRLVIQGAKILILDEPTSILAPQEAELLFNHIKRFASAGHVVILVTHKIHHVRAVAHRVTVLRRGKVVATGKTEEMSDEQLTELMMGEHPDNGGYVPKKSSVAADRLKVLTITNLAVTPAYSPHGVNDLNLSLYAGEIVGVAGMSGNGQDELVSAIAGLQPFKGCVSIQTESGGQCNGRSLGYIPSDKWSMGVAQTLSVADNLALRSFRDGSSWSSIILDQAKAKSFAVEKIKHFGIVPNDPEAVAATLSGGNIQKLILARELDGDPNVLIAMNPTAGLDVGTIRFVQQELRRQADRGSGILLISEDLDELLCMSNRIIVLYKGKIVGDFLTADADKQRIGFLMSTGGNMQDGPRLAPGAEYWRAECDS